MSDYPARLTKLQRRLRKQPFDAFYVGSPVNIRYLTGFTGSAGALLVEPDAATLYVDGRYVSQAKQQTSGIEVGGGDGRALDLVIEGMEAKKIRSLGFERNRSSLVEFERLRDSGKRRKLHGLDDFVEEQRTVKSDNEIELIRRACVAAAEGFDDWCAKLRPSWTEERAAAELNYRMTRRGATGPAFPTIIAGGAHSALPHARPRPVKLGRNSLILIDHGAIVDGYGSDVTRVVAMGEPGKEIRRIYRAVRDAQQAALAVVRAGVQMVTVDRAARRVLEEHGLAEYFTHSIGHGVGLEFHEAPWPRGRGRLREGMIVTVEPGAYVEGIGGVRIEDLAVVRKDGCEVLTPTSRDLRLL